MPKPSKGGFYAVHRGRRTGVFLSWEECEPQIKGFNGARYKKFTNMADAEDFVAGTSSSGPSIQPAGTTSSGNTEGSASTDNNGKRSALAFDTDEEGWDVVYCDGACKGNGQAGSVAGVGVWYGRNDPRNIAERCPGGQTNNRAELIAISRVLESTPRSKTPLLIKTDSQYCIKCFQEWLPKWQSNGFRSSTGNAVLNADLIRYVAALLESRPRLGQRVLLKYVKAHCGIEGNEGADSQANLGALLPAIEERDWVAMEREVRRKIEAELKKKATDVPVEMEPQGNGVVFHGSENGSSPRKVRKMDHTPSANSAASNSIVASANPVPLRQVIDEIPTDELQLYADCLVDDDDLWNDLSD